jgi:hypothetical protein
MVTVLFVYRMKPRVQLIAAAVVALAEGRDDVDERAVDALEPRIVYKEDES